MTTHGHLEIRTKLEVIVGLFVLGSLSGVPSYGQTLAEAARLQQDRLRQAGAQARTYTNSDVPERSVGDLQPSIPPSASVETAQRSALEDFSPARFTSGTLPPLPVLAVGGGQVFVELTVGVDGRVTKVTPLQTTPPFTDLLINSVSNWSFLPAEKTAAPKPDEPVDQNSPTRVESKVLVAGQFRAPALYGGTTLGELPRQASAPSPDGLLPLATIEPLHALSAFSSGVVLVEAEVDSGGAVTQAKLLRAAPPYDPLALAAARQWKFRPAQVDGRPVKTLAYLVFGFPVPIGGGAIPVPIGGGAIETKPPTESSTPPNSSPK
jgi:TonB family protein